MSVSGAWGMAIVSVALVSALPLAGFAMLSRERLLGRAVPHLISLAVGAMIGAALLELIPEGFRRLGTGSTASLLTIGGFVGFFLLERMLSTHGHRLLRRASPTPMQPYAILILVGDGVHNALDGAVIAASYIADPLLGFSTTIAVVLHEIPHELGDFGALVHSGLPVRRAVLLNFGSALTALLGAIATLAAQQWTEGLTTLLLPVAAGNFLYVGAADLLPELHREPRSSRALGQVGLIVLGIALVELPELVPRLLQ